MAYADSNDAKIEIIWGAVFVKFGLFAPQIVFLLVVWVGTSGHFYVVDNGLRRRQWYVTS